METFALIMIYSVMVLVGLSVAAAVLVGAGHWLVDNTAETSGH